MAFSDSTNRLLAAAGWTEGRTADTAPMEHTLRAKGFPVFPAQKRFLARFGGLAFHNPAAVPPAAEDWHFRIDDALRHASAVTTAGYAKLLGAPVSVIGNGFGDYLLLVMDEDGRVYGGYDQVFLRVGDSGEDAIEALATGRELVPVATRQAT